MSGSFPRVVVGSGSAANAGLAALARASLSCLLDRTPYPLGGERHSHRLHGERFQRVEHGVVDGTGRSDGARFADSLDTEWMVRWGGDRREDVDLGQHVGPGDGVVGERPGQQLSGVVVNRLFPQGLTDSLHNTT